MAHTLQAGYAEPLAVEAAAFLRTKAATIREIVERGERLADAFRARPISAGTYVLCHGDVHPGNVLITPRDELFLVDWDTLRYAPREQDFVLIDNAAFFAGYGPASIDHTALAYY